MDKLFKEIQEKREAYNIKLAETRSKVENDEDITETMSQLEEERNAITALEKRYNQMKQVAELEEFSAEPIPATPEKRFTPKPSGEVHTVLPAETVKDEVREGIEAYVRAGEIRESVTTVNQEVIVPKDISYVPQKEIETTYDLSKYFASTDVGTKSGSYPVLENPTDALPTVEELKENPELGAPNFHEVKWEIKTYRGSLPISQEAIDDTEVDLTALIAEQIQRRILNTTNSAISKVLSTFTAVPVSTKDDLVDVIKEVLNVKLDPAYIPQIVCTQSFYQDLDTLKDKNGQYIFHQDITSGSGATLLGVPVIKVPDTMLSENAGDKVAFIGDRRAVTVFDRKQASIAWVDDRIYGRYLMGVIRFDVEVTDAKAGYLLTVNPATK